MAEIILAADETTSREFSGVGTYKIVCLAYGNQQVDLQIKDRGPGTAWVSLREGNSVIRFDRAGEAYNVVLCSGFTYRFNTSRAGSIIGMDRIGRYVHAHDGS